MPNSSPGFPTLHTRTQCSQITGLRPVLESMAVARSQLAVMAGDVRQGAEAVVLYFEEPVRVIEGFEQTDERHRTERLWRHSPTLPAHSSNVVSTFTVLRCVNVIVGAVERRVQPHMACPRVPQELMPAPLGHEQTSRACPLPAP